jgi:hypothetical protein
VDVDKAREHFDALAAVQRLQARARRARLVRAVALLAEIAAAVWLVVRYG